MRNPDAKRWDERYAAEGEFWLERNPRQLLLDYLHLIPRRGLALDAAAGVSNNGLFLARRGLRVIAVDISEIGLRLAVRRARAEALPLEAFVRDLSDPWFPQRYFDVILNFHFLERATFPAFRLALKPGGLIFFETFLRIDPHSANADYYLEPGELRRAFEEFEILHWEETYVPESDNHPERGSAQLVARKPD